MIREMKTRTLTQKGTFHASKTNICRTFITRNMRREAPRTLERIKNPAPVLYDQKPKRFSR
jgi:hypothetical protein